MAKMKTYSTITFFLSLILVTAGIKAQSVPELVVRNDTTICIGQPILLQSHLLNAPGNTNNYAVNPIPFNPDPFIAGTRVILNDDDQTGLIHIGFNFCYFGNTYSNFIIASNGWVGFSSGQSNTWSGNTIPNASGFVPKNAIMLPWQDLDPRWGGQISYQLYGTAPFRRLVVSYNNIPLYASGMSGCGVAFTGQIKIFETTNVIETQILNKPVCTTWNSGAATHGIQNSNGSVAYVVNGRNNSVWSTSGEGYAFQPNGASNVNVNWFCNNVVIASGTNVLYTPSSSCQLIAVAYYGCGATLTDSAKLTVTVDNLTVSNTITHPISCNGLSNGQITANATAGAGGVVFNWNTNPTQTAASANNLSAGAYTVTVSDLAGCIASATTILTQPAILNLSATTLIAPTCSYSADGQIALTTAGGTAPYFYKWSNDSKSEDLVNLTNGTYKVLVMDNNGCIDSFTTNLNTPEIKVTAGADQEIYAGQSATVEAQVNTANTFTFTWSPELNVNAVHSARTTLSPRKTTPYTVSISDANGCIATDEITVFVNVMTQLPIYNAFTPNHDGNNDLFTLRLFHEMIQLVSFRIYNRYGQPVYSSEDIDNGWDGTFNGKDQEIGTYIYEVSFLDANSEPHLLKGNVSLLR